jgi:hypothetical protein
LLTIFAIGTAAASFFFVLVLCCKKKIQWMARPASSIAIGMAGIAQYGHLELITTRALFYCFISLYFRILKATFALLFGKKTHGISSKNILRHAIDVPF